MALQDDVVAALRADYPDEVVGEGAHAGQRWIELRRDRIVDALRLCRDRLGADMLMDLTAVDWLDQGKRERFQIVYQLFSLGRNEYARVKAWVPEDDPEIATVTPLWKAAGWAEREVWDLFGIRFAGNRDLRRLVLPENYPGHPLRKDYPLIGHGERNNFPRYGL
jgi:NADH-quinone oxidoreductase subunit C